MKNTSKKSIREVIDLDKQLFYSNLYFPNEVIIGEDFDKSRTSSYADLPYSTLYLNSKTDKNGNMYEQFIERNFRKPLEGYCGSTYGKDISFEVFPYVTLMDGENRRYLGISKAAGLSSLVLKSFPDTIEMYFKEVAEAAKKGEKLPEDREQEVDDDNIYTILKDCLKSDRAIVKSVMEGTSSNEIEEMIKFMKPDGSPVSPSRRKQMLQELYDKYTQKIMAVKFLKNLYGKELDTEKFTECFDYDKLCLIMALSSYLDVRTKTDNGEQIPGSMMYLYDYCSAVKHFRKENPSYNESIKISVKDDRGRRKISNFTTNDIIYYLQEFMEAHPELKSNEVSMDELTRKFGISKDAIEHMNPKEYTELIQDLLEKEKKLKSLTVNWEILPTKEGEAERITGARIGESTSKLKDEDIINRSNIFNSYIASLPSLLELKGRNDFDGYVAHVFSNGKVILEKPKSGKKGEYYSATYVMPLDSFFDLSMLSRTEIMEGLSNGEITDVKRIYHTFDIKSEDPIHAYKSRIEGELEGSTYSKEMIDGIYSIIEEQREKSMEDGYQRKRTSQN